jgi:exopolysaccharide production protein ExoQ
MASFIVYYGLFRLTPLPAYRRRRVAIPAEDERHAGGRMPAPI